MDLLVQKLFDILDGERKVVVFSQFVELLKLVAAELDSEKIDYSYLDGQSRKRDEIIRDFKECEKKQVFLISLKAGGVGLNLTEADYCFILDPWWNPAAEATGN